MSFKNIRLIVLSLISFTVANVMAQQILTEFDLPPGSVGLPLSGVASPRPGLAFAVAGNGKVFKIADMTVTQQVSGSSSTWWKDVSFPDTVTGYVVGSAGEIIKTTDGGNSWTPLASGTTAYFEDIDCPTVDICYAVALAHVILKTTNGGATWVSKSSRTSPDIHTAAFLGPDTGWLGSDSGIFKTTNGGDTWVSQPVTLTCPITSLQMLNANEGFGLECGGYLQKTTNGGASWIQKQVIPHGENIMTALHFVNAKLGYVSRIGYGAGSLYRTLDGGEIWTVISTSAEPWDLVFSGKIGYTAGNNGKINKISVLDPGTPALSTPLQAAQNVTLSTTLSWAAAIYTDYYHVQVSTDALFSTLLLNDSAVISPSTNLFNLSPSTLYYWRVRGKNVGGIGDWSAARSFTTVPPIPDVPALSAPASGLTDAPLSNTLSWAASSGAVSYRVQLSTNAGFTALVKDTSQATTSKLVGTLANGTTYYWRVSATNPGGTSAYSTASSFTTVPVPAAPTLVSPDAAAIHVPISMTLNWGASTHALTYRIQLSTSATFTTTVVNDSTVTGTSRAVGPLANNTTYYWRVNAKNGGTSAYSTVNSFTTIPAVPAVPVLSSPAASAVDVVRAPNLTWAAVSGADTYRVQLSTDSNFVTTTLDDSTVSAVTVAPGTLPVGVYYWRVNAKNAGGTSVFSSKRKFTTVPEIPPAPVLASPVSGVTDAPISLTLNWGAATGAVSYRLQLATDAGFSSLVKDTILVITNKPLPQLPNNTAYHWRVSATNAGGTSPYSAVSTFTTVAIPAVPSLVSPALGEIHVPVSTTLNWNASANALTYRVQLSTSASFTTTLLNDSTQTATSRAVGPLANNTTYYWRVNAKNGGTSAYSTVNSFTTLPAVPGVPVLSVPASEAVDVPRSTSLSWISVSGADTYRVQLSTDATFASPVLDDSTLTGTTQAVGPLPVGVYFWRVNAKNAGGTSAYSIVRKFTTVPEIPGVPSPATPAPNAVDVSVSTSLTWGAVVGATTYAVQLSRDSLFSTTLVNDTAITATSRIVNGLLYNTTHYWRLRAKNSGGTSAYSVTVKFTTAPLSVPALLAPAQNAVGVAPSPTLSWNAVAGATAYHVQFSTDSSFATTVVNDTALGAATRTVGPLTAGGVYFWRVRARNLSGASDWSSGDWSGIRRFTVLTLPAVPVLSSPAPDSANVAVSTNLVWLLSGGAATYRVQLATDSLFAAVVADDSTLTATTRAVGPLSNNTAYYWRVSAQNAAGASAYSATRRFTTVPVQAPVLSAPAQNAVNIPVLTTLAWNASSGATAYALQVSTDSLFTTVVVNDLLAAVTTRAVGPLTPGTAYFWRVNAQNVASTSVWSAVWKFTTQAIPSVPVPALPANDSVDVPVSATLTWLPPAGAATYRVQLSTDSTFATTVVNDSTLAATSRAVTGLLNGTTYYWRVNAKNGGGTSAYSPVRRFTTVAGTAILGPRIAFRNSGVDGNALRFNLPRAAHVSIRLYDSKGTRVAELVNEKKQAGSYDVPLSGANAAGLYLLDFRAGSYHQILKLIR